MRLLQLHLAAFGAFSGKTLDFSASPGALSVVYGHNEAGKSTSLRAYEGLLFGIDSTADAFLHGTKKLRVGGTFRSDAGEELTVYRRRGKKDTLIDENDQPLDEAKLKKLLRGVDRDLFAALYGLDHVRLREGKKALFAEGSSVAEGLFEASLSGAGVGQLAKALREEADALFTGRARKLPLNDAITAYKTAVSQTRMHATSSSAYQQQLDAIERAKQERSEAEDELVKLERSRRSLERGIRVAPLLAQRRALVAKKAELAGTLAAIELPFDAAEARAELSELLGAARDNPKRATEIASERLVLEQIVAEQPAGRRALDIANERAVLELLSQRDEARRALVRAEEQAAEERAAEAHAIAQLAAVTARPLEENERLRAALEAAEQALAQKVQRDSDVSRRIEREGHARALSAELGASDPDALAALPAAPLDQVESACRRHDGAARVWKDEQSKLAELERTAIALRRERDELLARGPSIGEADLESARRARDSALDAAFNDGSERVRGAARDRVREADTLSDRLRLEAERLARLGAAERSLAAAEAAVARAMGACSEAAAAVVALEREVFALLDAAGGPALDPAATLSWFTRRANAVEALAVARAAALSSETIERAAAAAAATLVTTLGSTPLGEVDPFARLRDAIARGRAVLSAESSLRARIDSLTLEQANAGTSAVRVEMRARAARTQLEEAAARAATVLADLGLARDLSREDLLRFAQDTRRAADAAIKLRKLDAELSRAAEQGERLREKTRLIASALGREELPTDPVAAAELTLTTLSRVHRDIEARRELEREIENVTGSILAAGGNISLADLERDYAGFDVEQAELDDARLEEERAELERKKEQAAHQRVALEQASAKMHESRASEYAEQAALQLARAKALALRYASLRLGSALLDREVEQYQKLHQAPVLTRAAEHFKLLTRGAYQDVRATLNEDDQPELSTVRGGEDVGIEGLSDGAKDQLFLALRLATIERHTEGVESLPLVFDDVLVHFDEQRSAAALELFASIAPRMQVLLFTHQERIVELASRLGSRVQIVTL